MPIYNLEIWNGIVHTNTIIHFIVMSTNVLLLITNKNSHTYNAKMLM